jgi:hypothetical protein
MKLTFFDFTYYFISKAYSNAGEKGYQLSATAILSGTLTMNLMLIAEFSWLIYRIKDIIYKQTVGDFDFCIF